MEQEILKIVMQIKIEITRKTMIKTVQRKIERKRGEHGESARARSVV